MIIVILLIIITNSCSGLCVEFGGEESQGCGVAGGLEAL